MRSPRVFGVIVKSLRRAWRRPERFRIVQFSVQPDHSHLLAEAQDKVSLSRGIQGLSISLAKRVNRELGRSGPLFADRFHARALESPRAVRNAIVYILANYRKHALRQLRPGIDLYSSAPFFDGWLATREQHAAIRRFALHVASAPPVLRARVRGGIVAVSTAAARASPARCIVPARTWLASVGWRRIGLIALSEQPVRPG